MKSILKLNNTVVEKLTIDSTNGEKLLESNNSSINSSSFVMDFDSDGLPSDNISEDLIELNESSLNIDTIDISSIANLTHNVIFSYNNSKSYTTRVFNDGDASPSWTDRFASNMTYGNGMSYNIYSGRFVDSSMYFSDNVLCLIN